jgi:hypothetical protein
MLDPSPTGVLCPASAIAVVVLLCFVVAIVGDVELW